MCNYKKGTIEECVTYPALLMMGRGRPNNMDKVSKKF